MSAHDVLTIAAIPTEFGVRYYPMKDGKNFTTPSLLDPNIRSVISFPTEQEAKDFIVEVEA